MAMLVLTVLVLAFAALAALYAAVDVFARVSRAECANNAARVAEVTRLLRAARPRRPLDLFPGLPRETPEYMGRVHAALARGEKPVNGLGDRDYFESAADAWCD